MFFIAIIACLFLNYLINLSTRNILSLISAFGKNWLEMNYGNIFRGLSQNDNLFLRIMTTF